MKFQNYCSLAQQLQWRVQRLKLQLIIGEKNDYDNKVYKYLPILMRRDDPRLDKVHNPQTHQIHVQIFFTWNIYILVQIKLIK